MATPPDGVGTVDLDEQPDGTWTAALRGIPVTATGTTRTKAAEQMTAALRNWADDWTSRRKLVATTPEVGRHYAELIGGCDDEQLLRWTVSG